MPFYFLLQKNVFFFFRILSILIHTYGERGEGLKETNSDAYPKGSNSWIHKTDFKSF